MFPPSQLFRERYFGNHLSEKEKSSGQWLTSYPLFLRGSGNPIERIQLKKLSQIIKLHVYPMAIRHFWCTWLGTNKVCTKNVL